MSGAIPKFYHQVHALIQTAQYQAAVEALDASPALHPGTHYRQRAYALHNLHRFAEAHADMWRAHDACAGHPELRGTVLVEWAVMYMREQRFGEGFRTYHEALALLQAPDGRATALYNLGWTYLRRLHLGEAQDMLYEGLRDLHRPAFAPARWRLTHFRCALSLHARITGQWTLALQRAEQAVRQAPQDRAAVYALNTLAATHRLQGDLTAALSAQQRAVELAGPGHDQLTETLHLGLIRLQLGEDTRGALESAVPLAAPYDAWRARLHLAQQAARAGDVAPALSTLQAALAADEPYVLLDEAPVLPDLYALGRQAGLPLPAPVPARATHLHVATAVPAVHLGGFRLPLVGALPVGVILYLHREGPATLSQLASALLDLPPGETRRGEAQIRAALRSLAYVSGSDQLLARERGRWRLDPGCDVSTDLTAHPGPVLPELYGPWLAELTG